MGSCGECGYYAETECRRYPPSWRGFVRVGAGSWCGEFKLKEVEYAIEERKVEISSVPEYTRVDELWATTEAGDSHSDEQGGKVQEQTETIKRRGWPKGKPRK